MQGNFLTESVDQVIELIQKLDLESIKLKIMDPELGAGWTTERVGSAECEYREFLVMLLKYPEQAERIVISKDADEFWHQHIMHTRKYHEDCQRLFGGYLHHSPHIGIRTQADREKQATLMENTRRLYQEVFEKRTANSVAWCSAAVEGKKAAWCSATIETKTAAWCSAAIEDKSTAWCSAAIEGKKAAWCSASIERKAAIVKEKGAAWCSATIKDENAAWCSAAIEQKPLA